MKIAVTGAAGLLGNYIVERLISDGHTVVPLVRKKRESLFPNLECRTADITNPVSLEVAFAEVDAVVHAAAFVSLNPAAKKEMFRVNVDGTRNVVDMCHNLGISKLVHISSVAALAKPKGLHRIDENVKWIPGKHNTDYGESKYLAELEVYRGQEEGLQTTIVSPSVILAPAAWHRSSARLFKLVWDEKPFYTQGQFNYVDVRDVCFAISGALQQQGTGEKYITSAGSINFIDFFSAVAQRLNKRKPFIAMPPWLVEFAASIDLARARIFGGEPFMDKKALRINREAFVYDNSKATQALGLSFRSLQESLDWCCAGFLARYTTNN